MQKCVHAGERKEKCVCVSEMIKKYALLSEIMQKCVCVSDMT